MDPPELGTFRDLMSEKGDFVILVSLLWTPRIENPNRASANNRILRVDLQKGEKILQLHTPFETNVSEVISVLQLKCKSFMLQTTRKLLWWSDK